MGDGRGYKACLVLTFGEGDPHLVKEAARLKEGTRGSPKGPPAAVCENGTNGGGAHVWCLDDGMSGGGKSGRAWEELAW